MDENMLVWCSYTQHMQKQRKKEMFCFYKHNLSLSYHQRATLSLFCFTSNCFFSFLVLSLPVPVYLMSHIILIVLLWLSYYILLLCFFVVVLFCVVLCCVVCYLIVGACCMLVLENKHFLKIWGKSFFDTPAHKNMQKQNNK